MNLKRAIAQPAHGALLFAALFAVPAGAISPIPSASPAPPSGRWREASLDDYRAHLSQLIPLVRSCARARDLKTCDPLLVGPDDRVPLGIGPNPDRRLIRYGWLRILFSVAEEPDQAPEKAPASNKDAGPFVPQAATPPTSKLLAEAEQRLTADLAQVDASSIAPNHAAERGVLAQVLAGHDFRDLEQPTVGDSLKERFGNWLNHLLENVARLRAQSAWIGRLLVWGFILAVCVALAWALLQLERRWRVRLLPEQQRSAAPTSPSARNWQLWLEDARRAAASGMWREAVHFVYWAAIARLESRRLWPADRARTPREYLALLAQEDPRRSRLAALTGSFERIWYGGRSAEESDYRHAEEIATVLIDGGQGAGPERGSAGGSAVAGSGIAAEGGRA